MYRAIGTKDERTLTITDKDVLWLMRMCVGEGGKNCSQEKVAAMLWAMANRFLLHPGRKHWKTFLYMVRRFSQPINPRWQTNGDLATRHAGKPSASEKRLARRREICRLRRNQIPSPIIQEVVYFQEGRSLPPLILDDVDNKRISNWASYPSVRKKFPHGIDIDGDWFFEDKRLDDGVVVVDHWSEK